MVRFVFTRTQNIFQQLRKLTRRYDVYKISFVVIRATGGGHEDASALISDTTPGY